MLLQLLAQHVCGGGRCCSRFEAERCPATRAAIPIGCVPTAMQGIVLQELSWSVTRNLVGPGSQCPEEALNCCLQQRQSLQAALATVKWKVLCWNVLPLPYDPTAIAPRYQNVEVPNSVA
jgi:hypothetical protein